ncbi:hypothetical protein V8F33_004186 [Rhypophila sp. PSN 637]
MIDGILAKLRGWFDAKPCSLRFNDVPIRKLVLACGGQTGCDHLVCKKCIQNWYGLNRPGKVINVGALTCPFCRRRPAPGTRGCRKMLGLHGWGAAVEEADEWVHAWCKHCGAAKRHTKRSCAEERRDGLRVISVQTGWYCRDCRLGRVKNCPGCGIATEKTYGCNSMKCAYCKTKWC